LGKGGWRVAGIQSNGQRIEDPAGKPISAQQFVEQLFGKLPELVRDEDELRRIWSNPETRVRRHAKVVL
jgi:hypothetical protein